MAHGTSLLDPGELGRFSAFGGVDGQKAEENPPRERPRPPAREKVTLERDFLGDVNAVWYLVNLADELGHFEAQSVTPFCSICGSVELLS